MNADLLHDFFWFAMAATQSPALRFSLHSMLLIAWPSPGLSFNGQKTEIFQKSERVLKEALTASV
jgi:hypothetical protein